MVNPTQCPSHELMDLGIKVDLHLQQPRSTTQRVFVETHESLYIFGGLRGENLGERDLETRPGKQTVKASENGHRTS